MQSGFFMIMIHKHIDTNAIFLLGMLISYSLFPDLKLTRKEIRDSVLFKEIFDLFNFVNYQLRDLSSTHL